MTASIVVPHELGNCKVRQRNWVHLRERWSAHYPRWPIVYGTCPGEWRVAQAITNGVMRAPPGIVIIADADVWVPSIERAVHMAREKNTWVEPYKWFITLTDKATKSVIRGDLDLDRGMRKPQHWDKPPKKNPTPCAGIVVMPRDLALGIPGDTRFKGWGWRDKSWGIALNTLAGPSLKAGLLLAHFWHPYPGWPKDRAGNPDNYTLYQEYVAAEGDQERMRVILQRARQHAER